MSGAKCSTCECAADISGCACQWQRTTLAAVRGGSGSVPLTVLLGSDEPPLSTHSGTVQPLRRVSPVLKAPASTFRRRTVEQYFRLVSLPLGQTTGSRSLMKLTSMPSRPPRHRRPTSVCLPAPTRSIRPTAHRWAETANGQGKASRAASPFSSFRPASRKRLPPSAPRCCGST
jgi:hypothetical protein